MSSCISTMNCPVAALMAMLLPVVSYTELLGGCTIARNRVRPGFGRPFGVPEVTLTKLSLISVSAAERLPSVQPSKNNTSSYGSVVCIKSLDNTCKP